MLFLPLKISNYSPIRQKEPAQIAGAYVRRAFEAGSDSPGRGRLADGVAAGVGSGIGGRVSGERIKFLADWSGCVEDFSLFLLIL